MISAFWRQTAVSFVIWVQAMNTYKVSEPRGDITKPGLTEVDGVAKHTELKDEREKREMNEAGPRTQGLAGPTA